MQQIKFFDYIDTFKVTAGVEDWRLRSPLRHGSCQRHMFSSLARVRLPPPEVCPRLEPLKRARKSSPFVHYRDIHAFHTLHLVIPAGLVQGGKTMVLAEGTVGR